MQHTKFNGNWFSGSGEEDCLRFLPYIGMVAIMDIKYKLFFSRFKEAACEI